MTFILAHGLGGRVDLPIPVSLAQWGAAGVIGLTFVILAKLWRQPKFEGDGGRPVPGLQRLVDARATSMVLRSAGFVVLGLVLAVCLFGENNSAVNPGPTWVDVWFWVGLVPVSMLIGPVWRRMDPLPVLSALFRRFVDVEPDELRRYPEKWGRWPAAIGVFGFAWLELVAPDRDMPSTVGGVVLLYMLAHLVGGTVYGPVWHERGAAFSTLSDYVARFGPWMRRGDGTLVFANPLRNLAALPSGPGVLAVAVVLLGSTAFDGLTRTQTWTDWTRDLNTLPYILVGTAGLVTAMVVIAFTVTTAVFAGAKFLRPEQPDAAVDLPSRFAASIVPIAIGYTVAHYFSLLFFQGQSGYLLASDPFGAGWNLFGTAGKEIDYGVLTSRTIAWVQVAAIVTGHFFGVLSAHDRAAALFREENQREAQTPMILAMVAYTAAGIGLLLGG